MSRTDPDLNTVQLTIFVNEEEHYASSLYWNFDQDTFDDETIEYMKSLGTGLLYLLQSDPEYVATLGDAYLEGHALGNTEKEGEVVFDATLDGEQEKAEESPHRKDNVVTLKPSKTKH